MALLRAALAALLATAACKQETLQMSNETHRAVRVFLSSQPHRCMHVLGFPQVWEHVQSWHCPTDAHLGTNFWLPRDQHPGLIALVNYPGLCLDNPHGSLIQLWYCEDTAKENNMLFQAQPAPPWLTLHGYDLPGDAEVKAMESSGHARRYAEKHGYTAFSIVAGAAHFKRAHNVTCEDLRLREGAAFHLYRRNAFTLRLARSPSKCVGVQIDAKRGNLFHMLDCSSEAANVSLTFGAEPITESLARAHFSCDEQNWEHWSQGQRQWCCMVERLHCPSISPHPRERTWPSWLLLAGCALAGVCCIAASAAYFIPKLKGRNKRQWLFAKKPPIVDSQTVWRLGRIVNPMNPYESLYEVELSSVANGEAVLSLTNGQH